MQKIYDRIIVFDVAKDEIDKLRSEIRGLASGPGREGVTGAGLALAILQRLQGPLAAAHEEVLADVRELRQRWVLHWMRLTECRGTLYEIMDKLSAEDRRAIADVLARTKTDDAPTDNEAEWAKGVLREK